MAKTRSLLWIGPHEDLVNSGAENAENLEVTWVRDVGEALDLGTSPFDAAVLSARDSELLPSLRRLRRRRSFPPVVVRVSRGRGDRTRELLAAGASDVVMGLRGDERDLEAFEFLTWVVKVRHSRTEPALTAGDDPKAFRGVIGRSPKLVQVLMLVRRAAHSTATVLLTGETGTGKEVIAQALHQASPREGRPFVAVNCAAFPDTLLESELFGHTKGAFTGADTSKRGLFEEAHGGTLFLDEVAETSTPFQAKLLRVLQEREVRPVGSVRSRRVDVRVVAATNRPLREAVRAGRFREDLYYRLAVFPLEVPPLRDRSEDILPLAEHFLALHGAREERSGCRLSKATQQLLLAHTWPGNVRELENEMQRALALADAGDWITPSLLSPRVVEIHPPQEAADRPGESLRDSLARIESWLIRRALERNGQQRTLTARQLGVTREGLYKKMKRLGIE